eukprot:TRINITY_DN7856_c0_g1_i1.p1 TRINITY_DN7856_c0_g1~~TRINITY_DN7856_c0_g1_i1.p1  ORF type:complete len:906 (+),score=243.11 TRINITY_DN7856_c0_g1_i1:249-2720(+)
MPLTDCQAKCGATPDCTGVVWSPVDQQCYRRADINIAACTKQWGAQWDTYVAYRPVPQWSEFSDLNCWEDGHGAGRLIGSAQGYNLSTAQCLQKCESTAGCTFVVVSTTGSDWCWMRGGGMDYYKCSGCQGRCSVMVMGATVPAVGQADRWWQRPLMTRTLAPQCDGMSVSAVLNTFDEMMNAGVRAVTLNSVYDSGSQHYNPANLWCGLGMSNLTAPNPALGGEQGLRQIVAKARETGIALVTWWNPAYFWTGSPYFKQAERDVKQYGTDRSSLPPDSPARWFWWSSSPESQFAQKPPDQMRASDMGRKWEWVWDADANACYFSTWADQPTVDFSSPEWRAELKRASQYWVDFGVDGFFLDYPDGYISAGYDSQGFWQYSPDVIKTAVVDPLKGGRADVAVFAEQYQSPDRALAYGLDGTLGDDYPRPRATQIVKAVTGGSSAGLDPAFGQAGGADETIALCYLGAPVNVSAAQQRCPVTWVRPEVMESGYPGGDPAQYGGMWNGYNCYTGYGADYAPDVSGVMPLQNCFALCSKDPQCDSITMDWLADGARDNSHGQRWGGCYKRGGVTISSCSTAFGYRYSTFSAAAPSQTVLALAISLAGGDSTCVVETMNNTWWGDAAWPGGDSGELRTLLDGIGQSSAFSGLALRARVGTSPAASSWATLRYDPFRGGTLGIAVFNLAAAPATVTVDLGSILDSSRFKYPPTELVSGRPGALLAPKYNVPLPARGYAFFAGLTLPLFAPQGFLNCYAGHGAAWSPGSSGNMMLAECMLLCVRTEQCRAVTVKWLAAGQADCMLRGAVDTAQCDTQGGRQYSTFTLAV